MTKVLVVDDDPAVRRLCRLVFLSEGIDVRLAEDGIEGLQAVREECPDVVVLDLAMPRLDGRGFVERLRHLDDRPPVLLLSAHVSDRLCREIGAEDCLSKPFDPDQLVWKIEQLI